LVYRIQIERSFFFALSAAQEHYADQRRTHCSGKRSDSSRCDFLGSHLRSVRIAVAWHHHVRLEEAAFEEDVVVAQRLEHPSQNPFSSFLAGGDVVVAVCEDFRLDDGHEAIFLTNSCVSRKSPCVFLDCQVRRHAISDL